MERRNSPYRFVLAMLAAATGAACDGPSSSAFKMHMHSDALAECSLSVPADSTALHLQRTVNAVLDAKLDACGGAVDQAGTSRELLGIDADDRSVHLLFRVVPNRTVPDSAPMLQRTFLE